MRPTFFLSIALLSFGVDITQADVPNERPFGFDIDVRTGWVFGDCSSGLSVGVSPRLRYQVLALGLDVQGATTILATSMGSLAATGGLALPWGRFRLDALGEFGVNGYTGVGASWLGDDPGASGALPFAGGRGALLVCVSCGPTGRSVWLGFTASYARDLYSVDETYTYVDPGASWFGEEYDAREVSNTVRLGQRRVAAFVTASFALPL